MLKNDMYINLHVYIRLSIFATICLPDSFPPHVLQPSSSLSCVVAEEYEVLAVAASLGKYKSTVYCITVSKPHIRR